MGSVGDGSREHREGKEDLCGLNDGEVGYVRVGLRQCVGQGGARVQGKTRDGCGDALVVE